MYVCMWQKYVEIDICQIYANIVHVTTAHLLNTHGYGNHVCLLGELWLHGWPNLGNVQVQLAA